MIDAIFKWAITDGGAAWTFGIGSVVVWIVLFFWKRPVVFSEISTSSLVDVDESLRDRIKVTFDDQPIRSLSVLRAEIFNTGKHPLKNATIKFDAGKDATILSMVAESSDSNGTITNKLDANKAIVTLEYLNPWRTTSHTIAISITIEGSSKDWRINGGGEGWVISQRNAAKQGNLSRSQIFTYVMAILFSITVIPVFFFLAGQSQWNFWLTTLGLLFLTFGWGALLGLIQHKLTSPRSRADLLNSVRHIPESSTKGQSKTTISQEELSAALTAQRERDLHSEAGRKLTEAYATDARTPE